MKDLLLDDAHDFLDSKEWYSERGIPFRRGYLLVRQYFEVCGVQFLTSFSLQYGAPGSGKTSMIHSLAGELGLDVYIISLSRAGLDDTALSALISELPERCIALMEDIDAAFHHGLTRDLDEEEGDQATPDEKRERDKEKEKEMAAISSPVSRVTLSGLLNALDGVGAQEGRILYATTNRYTALDPALCRPGRMDLHVEFKLASKYQARELFKCFYLPSHTETDETKKPETPVKSECDEHDSAYGTDSSRSSPASSVNGEAEAAVVADEPAQSYIGSKHASKIPQLSSQQVFTLADLFADAIPEREFSMASLQGYLMSFKVRPVEAAEGAAAWVAKERAEKARKSKKTSTSSSQAGS